MARLDRVVAPTNAWGTNDVYGGSYLYGYYGSIGGYYHRQVRMYPSNNPVLNTRGVPWRNPSRYRRIIWRFENVKSSHTGSLAGGWYLPGDNQSGLFLLTNYSGYWGSSSITLDTNIRNEANTEALLKIGDNRAQIGTMLAESQKTFEHLARTAIDLLRAYRAARRGHWKEVQRVLQLERRQVLTGAFPANRWLEYQYGWKPLLSDLHSIYSLLQQQVQSGTFTIKGKGFGQRSNSAYAESYASTSRLTYGKRYEATQICVVRLEGKFRDEYWRSASQWGLLNPLSIAWEVVPFSFVLDWFVPVGNVLEGLTARAGLDFASGSMTEAVSGRCDLSIVKSGRQLLEAGSATLRLSGVERTVLSGWPSPFLYVRDSPFSTPRTLSALSLWRSEFGRRFR